MLFRNNRGGRKHIEEKEKEKEKGKKKKEKRKKAKERGERVNEQGPI